jgi:DNA primase
VNPGQIRERADLESVMGELGLTFERQRDDLWFRCRSGEHPDNTPSCAITDAQGDERRHGMVYCQSCKWSTDVFGLVMAVKRCPFPEALRFVERHGRQNMVEGEEDPKIYDSLLRPSEPPDAVLPDGLQRIQNGSECYRYLIDRSFSRREIVHFRLMDWRAHGRLFIPCYREGRIISWVARDYLRGKPKVLTPARAAGAKWAMVNRDGLDRRNKEVHVTEGWASCFRVWQAGFTNVVAACGSRLKMEQVFDLAWVERFVMWQEGDFAGEGFTGEILAWLGRGRTFAVVELPRGTDPADHNTRGLHGLYERRRKHG